MTSPLTPLAQRLRNAYEAHDHDEFHAALARVGALEQQAACVRCCMKSGAACVAGCHVQVQPKERP